jgi:hypothetical protein
MPTDQTPTSAPNNAGDARDAAKTAESGERLLPPAAERALAEAAARRAQAEREKTEAPKEFAGRGGLDPARYGDWEVNGLISDF